jgi:hypothetical protein
MLLNKSGLQCLYFSQLQMTSRTQKEVNRIAKVKNTIRCGIRTRGLRVSDGRGKAGVWGGWGGRGHAR